MATIQDYETESDSIVLLQTAGTVTASVADSITTVLVDNAAVVDVGGIWALDELNISFEAGHHGIF